MDSILVTGGAGYIGAHVCKALSKAGYLPIAYDNLSTGHAYAVKWGPFVKADLSDGEKLNETMRKYQPKAVLHFAASALVIESVQNPGKYYRNNFVSSLSLLEAMRDHKIPYIVFSSTCAVYGQPQSIPLTESHPIAPVSPYGRSKAMIEQMLSDFDKAHEIRSVSLRYFNVAGADLETQIGENHEPETHLIPSILQTALGMRPEMKVFGTNFPSRDGSAIRDYIHVQDLADAHIKALEWLFETNKSIQINLGTGTGYSVLEIINTIQKYCGTQIPVKLERERPGEPSHLTADNTLAKELLGWTPRLSELPILIESAWKWHKLLSENIPLLKEALHKC